MNHFLGASERHLSKDHVFLFARPSELFFRDYNSASLSMGIDQLSLLRIEHIHQVNLGESDERHYILGRCDHVVPPVPTTNPPGVPHPR